MPATEIARRYFDALAAHDVEAAAALWAPGAIDRFVGQITVTAPEGVVEYFTDLFAAIPDAALEIQDITASGEDAAVRWRMRGIFAGPGRFQGFLANGASVEIEGCDVLTVRDERIVHNDAYFDSGTLARQLGVLPATGSRAEARLTALANARTRVQNRMHAGEPELVADGVWLIRGGFPSKTMNVYLLADGDGVTVFDAGIVAMTAAVAAAGARLGGIKRIVLGHADADHRGVAPGLRAPVLCHPAERAAAESSSSWRDYWDLSKLDTHGRLLLSRLIPTWDGGAVQIADTLSEGNEIAGFRVVELPGHAPGLIGLFRASDRLALVSDCFYTLDPQTGRRRPAGLPHPAFNQDTERARESIRTLAALSPSAVWAGHADPVTGDVAAQLAQAAA